MLKVILCDSSRDYMHQLADEIGQIIDRCEYKLQIILLATAPGEVREYLSELEGLSLYFLDTVYNPGVFDGIDLARNIREKDRDSYIVFNTVYIETAYMVMRGLIRPSGFFIKPIESFDLEVLLGDIYRDYLNVQGIEEDILCINIGSNIYRLTYNQIVYIEAFQKKVYIHTSNQRIGYYDSLSTLESRLGSQFIRCHKSYLVNSEKILRVNYTEMKIYMQNGAEIDISRTYKSEVKERLALV